MRTAIVFTCLTGLCAAGLCLANDEDSAPDISEDRLETSEVGEPYEDEEDEHFDNDDGDRDFDDREFDEFGDDDRDSFKDRDFDDEEFEDDHADSFDDSAEFDDIDEFDRSNRTNRRDRIRMLRRALFDEEHIDENEDFRGEIDMDMDDYRVHQIEVHLRNDAVMQRQILVDQLTEKLFENPDDQELRQRLKKELDALFDAQTKIREKKIAGLEKRISRLRSQLQNRLDMKQRIIDLRLETLTNEAKGLTF